MARGAQPRIEGFETGEVLGRGGFSVVYRARQLSVGRDVAVKVLSSAGVIDADAERRFRREVAAVAALSDHPHVVGVIDAGTTDQGRPFIAMQLVEGGSYGDRLQREGPLTAAEVARVGQHVADALGATHAAGIVHRDIKPGNILIGRGDRAMITDFGIASIDVGTRSRSGAIVGTLLYIAPEVLRGERAGPASDVCSLGATLYALLTGRSAYAPSGSGQHPAAVMARISRGEVPELPGSVPAALRDVVRRCMATAPDERPDVPEVLATLRSLAEPPATPSTPHPATPERRSSGAPPPCVPAIRDPHAPADPAPLQAGPPLRPSAPKGPARPPATPATAPPGPRPGSSTRVRSTLGQPAGPRPPASLGGTGRRTGGAWTETDPRTRWRRVAAAVAAVLTVVAVAAGVTRALGRSPGDEVGSGRSGPGRPTTTTAGTTSTTTTTTTSTTTPPAPPATTAGPVSVPPTTAPPPPTTTQSTTTTTTTAPARTGPDDQTINTVPIGGVFLLRVEIAPGGDILTVTPLDGWDVVVRVTGPGGFSEHVDLGFDGEPETVFLNEGSYDVEVSGFAGDDFGEFRATVG